MSRRRDGQRVRRLPAILVGEVAKEDGQAVMDGRVAPPLRLDAAEPAVIDTAEPAGIGTWPPRPPRDAMRAAQDWPEIGRLGGGDGRAPGGLHRLELEVEILEDIVEVEARPLHPLDVVAEELLGPGAVPLVHL